MDFPSIVQVCGVAVGALIGAAWQGVVLVLALACCLRLLPGLTAAARSGIWFVALLLVVALPFVRFGHRAVPEPGASVFHLDAGVSLFVAMIWGTLSLLRLVQLGISGAHLRRVVREACPVAVDSTIAPLLWRGKSVVSLCVSEAVNRPSVVGFLRPKILLPSSLPARLTAEELRQVVLHEMEHLHRGDDWTNLFQKIAVALFPLHPALHWVEHRLCQERELACDDRVLEATGARKAYAACLANLAEQTFVRRGISLALGAWERQSELAKRVERILRGGSEMSQARVAVAVAVLVAGMGAGGNALTRLPQLVSFGQDATTVARSASTAEGAPGGQRESAGQATYVRAVMPARNKASDAQDVGLARVAVRRYGAPRMVRSKAIVRRGSRMPAMDFGPRLVVVTWSASGGSATAQTLQYRYAAVPTGNGWLFVQL